MSDHLSREIKSLIFVDEGDHMGFTFSMRRHGWINIRILFDALNYNHTLKELMVQKNRIDLFMDEIVICERGACSTLPIDIF